MAKYFVEPYINYYSKLTENEFIVSNSNLANEKSKELLDAINGFQNLTSNISWTELGLREIAEYSIPALKTRIEKLNKNVEVHLATVSKKSIDELLPKLDQLKQKDQLLSDLNNELNSLKNSLSNDDNTDDSTIEGNITEKSNAINNLERELQNLKIEIDNLIAEIKSIDNAIEEFPSSASGIPEIYGLELTTEEEDEIGTFEEYVKKYADEKGITYEEALVILFGENIDLDENVGTGKTILYNDAGSVKKGYSRTIRTSHGKLVKVYQQAWSQNLPFNHKGDKHEGKTLAGHGCGHHALTSILTSIIPDITPEEVFELANGRAMCQSTAASVCKKLNKKNYDVSVSEHHTDLKKKDFNAYKNWIISEVKKGNMGLSSVGSGPDQKYTKTTPGHWVAIVDYDESSNKFYISDSADENDDNASPIDADLFLRTYDVDTLIIYL